jgi:hypothetical protein
MNVYIIISIIILILLISIYVALKLEYYLRNKLPFYKSPLNFAIQGQCYRENFTVADANDFTNYNTIKMLSDTANNDDIRDKIDLADDDDIVKYNDKDFVLQITNNDEKIKKQYYDNKKYISSLDFGMEFPDDFVGCSNSSINSKYLAKGKHLIPYEIACNKPNKIQAEEYYKTRYNKQIIPLEDRLVRGYNYGEYSNTTSPYKIDERILSTATKGLDGTVKYIPNGSNFAFHNTPAMRML